MLCMYLERPTGELPNQIDNQVTANDVLSLTLYDELDYAHATSSHVSPSSAADTLNSATDNMHGSSSNAVSLPAVETYSGLESSSREPQRAPIVYDRPRMTQPDYVNTRPDGVAPSATETPYCGLESSTREPPPAPAVYDTMTKHEYVNTMPNGAAPEVIRGTPSEEPHSNPEISSNVSPSSAVDALYSEIRKVPRSSSNANPLPAEETPYSVLESSTREPPPATAEYDTVVKSECIDTGDAATEVMCGTASEELESNA